MDKVKVKKGDRRKKKIKVKMDKVKVKKGDRRKKMGGSPDVKGVIKKRNLMTFVSGLQIMKNLPADFMKYKKNLAGEFKKYQWYSKYFV